MTSPTLANPSTHEQEASEILALGFDVTAQLDPGEEPTAPTATLIDMTTGEDAGNQLFSAPSAFQQNRSVVSVGGLTPGHRYRLTLHYVVSQNAKEPSVSLFIDCPF
jgi:hypothetical protein